MSRYKNIRNVLFVSAILLTVFFSVYLIINGYHTLSSTFEGASDVLSLQRERQQALTEMYRAARERSVLLLEMSVENDAFKLDDLRQKMSRQASIFIKNRHKLEKINQSAEQYWRDLDNRRGKKVSKNSVLQNRVADLFTEGRKK